MYWGYSLKPSMLPMKRARTVEPQDEKGECFARAMGWILMERVTRATVGQVRLEWWVSKECGGFVWCKSDYSSNRLPLLVLAVQVGRETSSWYIIAQCLISEGRTGEGKWNSLTGQQKGVTGSGRMRKAEHVVWTREWDEAKEERREPEVRGGAKDPGGIKESTRGKRRHPSRRSDSSARSGSERR